MVTAQVVSLSADEKRVVKGLLNRGWRNQDIQALINTGRQATINSARVTGVKQDPDQVAAGDEELAVFQLKKRSYDPRTGLNLVDDERLIRSREAMILAVQVFNSPGVNFKTEVFTVLVNIAWTYLLHEFYYRKEVPLVVDGRSLLLSQMILREDCRLSTDIKNNLNAVKILRDQVEHLYLGLADRHWSPIFQSCCLNYDKAIRDLFGERLSLAEELSFALQFARPSLEQLAPVAKYQLPAEIRAVDALITEGLTEDQIENTEFQFRVIYTFDAASKSTAHYQFINPESSEGKEIHNVLAKRVAGDSLYPFKPQAAADRVAALAGQSFTSTDHTKARRFFKARPKSRSLQPGNTERKYCLYRPAHRDYTYSQEWVDMLVELTSDPQRLATLRAFKL